MRTARCLSRFFVFTIVRGCRLPVFCALGLRDGPLPESAPFTEALRGDKQHKEGERDRAMPKPKDKKKFALWLHPETLAKVEKQYRDDDCRSRSEFIEKAILFYAGYLAADNCRDYIPNVVVSTVKGSLDSLENRMASLLFKVAVELSMMLHVTSAANAIDENTLTRLRGLCVEEVKRLHGAVRMEDAVRFQKGGAPV